MQCVTQTSYVKNNFRDRSISIVDCVAIIDIPPKHTTICKTSTKYGFSHTYHPPHILSIKTPTALKQIFAHMCKIYSSYIVVQDLVDISDTDYLTPATVMTRFTHSRKLRQFSTSSDSFKFSLFPRTIPLRNSVPTSVAEAYWHISRRSCPTSHSKQK